MPTEVYMIRAIFAGVLAVLGIAGVIGYTASLENGDSPVYEYANGEIVAIPSSQQKIDVKFSHKDTFYGENITVELSSNIKDAEIYFTTDGSDPTTLSRLYSTPIEINATPDVRATTIKALAVSGDKRTDVITKSYVVGKDVKERFSEDTYIFVLSTDEYNLYDYEYGIATEGKVRDDYIKEHPGETIEYTSPANFFMSGREWERPMYVEVYNSKGEQLISQLAGARVVGGYSRAVDQKSFKLIARKSYDPENGKFKYRFFEEAVNADGVPITEFDRIVLRNGANDREFAMVRDELSQRLAQDAGFSSTQGTAPCAVFLNGEYYGFSWLHQNYNENYLEDQFGGFEENYEIVSNTEQADEGNERGLDAYEEVKALINDGDFTKDADYKRFCELVDIDNFTLYYAIQIFTANRDWPGNNYKAWRYFPSENEEITSEYLDGKWRYLLFDDEFAWGLYGNGYRDRTINDLLSGAHMSGQSKALVNLVQRADFRAKLTNTLCDLMNGAYTYEHIVQVLQQKLDEGSSECNYAIDNGYTSTWAKQKNYEESRQQIVEFAENRAAVVKGDIVRSFGVTNDYYSISVTGAKGAEASLNTLKTTSGETLFGTYFTAYSVPLNCKEFPGYEFDYWEINGSQYVNRDVSVTPNMARDGVVTVKLVLKKVATADSLLYITEICTDKNAGWIELYNPNDTAISTKELYVSDDTAMLARYKLPTASIAPHSTLVIVAGNNSELTALHKIQADFSWKEGETAIVSDTSGTIISSVYIPALDKGQTYSRGTDGKYTITAASMGVYEE